MLDEMVRGVFHHEGDQLSHQALELLVDQVVRLQHLDRAVDVEAGERVERLPQLGDRELGLVGEVVDRQAQPARDAGIDQALDGARDPRRLVADPLQSWRSSWRSRSGGAGRAPSAGAAR
jgi:hypothetical protein